MGDACRGDVPSPSYILHPAGQRGPGLTLAESPKATSSSQRCPFGALIGFSPQSLIRLPEVPHPCPSSTPDPCPPTAPHPPLTRPCSYSVNRGPTVRLRSPCMTQSGQTPVLHGTAQAPACFLSGCTRPQQTSSVVGSGGLWAAPSIEAHLTGHTVPAPAAGPGMSLDHPKHPVIKGPGSASSHRLTTRAACLSFY